MKSTTTLTITMPSDREVVLQRVFNAPRELVWEAFTKRELFMRWFGPPGWNLGICELDIRTGGSFRIVLHGPSGKEVAIRGAYYEVVPPERSVHVESFDSWAAGTQVTSILTEDGDQTRLTATILYASQEVRDIVIQMGMTDSMAQCYDKLAELLAQEVAAPVR